jgi:hypothetical protein
VPGAFSAGPFFLSGLILIAQKIGTRLDFPRRQWYDYAAACVCPPPGRMPTSDISAAVLHNEGFICEH